MGDDDDTVRDNVLEELDFEPSVTAAHIGVTVEDGLVTLTGRVPLFYQRTKAEEAAWRVKGVRALVDELEVEQAGAAPHDDADLARRALARLDASATVPRGAVRVQAQKGWLILAGEVDWDYQREAAADALRTLPGTLGIVNRIGLVAREIADDVHERIERALHRHADVEAERVVVRVEGRRVRLTGRVDSALEREEVRRAAWSAPGVFEVVDELES